MDFPKKEKGGTRFPIITMASDVLMTCGLVLTIAFARQGHLFAPWGLAGDPVGVGLTVACVVVANRTFDLYRSPPLGLAFAWTGRVALAMSLAVGMIGVASVAYGHWLIPGLTIAILLFALPGFNVASRRIAQLTNSSLQSSYPEMVDAVQRGAAAYSEPAWNTDNSREELTLAPIPPSVQLLHLLDQWVVLLVLPWALPIAAAITISQRIVGRRVGTWRAPNGQSVSVFQLDAGSIWHRLGLQLLPCLWSVWRGQISLLDPELTLVSLERTRQPRKWIFIIGWMVTIRLVGFGYSTGDTTGHILQAQHVEKYDSWHPMLNVLIFDPSYRIFGSPILVTFLVTAAFWSALYVAIQSIYDACDRNLTTVGLLGIFSPVVFNYISLLAKDVFIAASLALCVALLMRERLTNTHGRLILVVAAFLSLVASMFNPTVSTIVLPILVYILARLLQSTSTPVSGHRRIRLAVATTLAVLLAISTIPLEFFLESKLGAANGRKEQALMLFDITGMSDDLGQNLLPTDFIPAERVDEYVHDCYNPLTWDSVAWWGVGQCDWTLSSPEAGRVWNSGEMKSVWIDAIKNHPAAYLRHRGRHIVAFLTTVGNFPSWYLWDNSQVQGGWKPEHNQVQDGYFAITQWSSTNFFFKPITWFVSVCGTLLAFVLRRRRRLPSSWGLLPVACCTGALLFYVGWAFIGLAFDFRYNYPVIWVFFISALMLTSDILLTRQGTSEGLLQTDDACATQAGSETHAADLAK